MLPTGDGALLPAAGEKVCLRPLGPDDLELLYLWENAPDVWQYGDCGACEEVCGADASSASSVSSVSGVAVERFSREELRQFIENQQYDIGVTGQQRFVICRRTAAPARSDIDPAACSDIVNEGRESDDKPALQPVGFIDLFDYDPDELSAGVGILICDPAMRNLGYGAESLELIKDYARRVLGLGRLWCNISTDNAASLALFSGAGFVSSETGETESRSGSRSGEADGNKKTLDLRQESPMHLFPSPKV